MNDLLIFEIFNLVIAYSEKTEEISKLNNVSISFKKSILGFALEYFEIAKYLSNDLISYNIDILLNIKEKLELSIDDLDDFVLDAKGKKKLYS